MSSLLWLAGALVAAVVAYLVGRPALSATRARQARDLNEERYLAWRGRAPSPSSRAPSGMTADERRRAWIAGALAALAVGCLIAFFAVS